MAIVPRFNSTAVPDTGGAPQLGVQTSSEAFGGGIAQQVSHLGDVSTQVGSEMQQRAMQLQELNNKAASDQAYSTHLDQANQFVEQYKTQNLGAAAEANLPDAIKTLSTQRTTIGDTLTSPMARAMYDADSRRALSSLTGELSRFAATQQKDYVLKQAAAVQDSVTSDTVLHPENFDANAQKLLAQQAFIDHQLGVSPEVGQLNARTAYGSMVSQVVEAMSGNGQITEASNFLAAHKDGMDGKVYEQTLNRLRPAVMANQAASIGDQAVARVAQDAGNNNYLTAVNAREGTGPNPHSTADGIGQFTEPTWLHVMKSDPQFSDAIAGKSDKEILAMRQDPKVANAAILSYKDENAQQLQAKGVQPTEANLGLAHGYGAGGAHAILAAAPNTPMENIVGATVAKNNGVLGKTAGQVVADFQQRFDNPNNTGVTTSFDLQSRMSGTLAAADALAEQQFPGNAQFKQQAETRAVAMLNRQIATARASESNIFQTLGQSIQEEQIQDQDTLFKSVPGAANQFMQLPLADRNALLSAMHGNATAWTPERQANIQQVNGAYAARNTNPQAYAALDIKSMDLPLNFKLTALKQQQEVAAKPGTMQDKLMMQVEHSFDYNQTIQSLGIKPKSDEASHLLGAVQAQVDTWRAANPNKSPSQKDIASMVAAATQQTNVSNYFLGVRVGSAGKGRAFDVDTDKHQAAIDYLQSKHELVNEETISRYTHATQGIRQEFAQAGVKSPTDAQIHNVYEGRINARK